MTIYEPFLHTLTAVDLLDRAVRNARSRKHGRLKHPRWVGVADAFALGSTYSQELCRKFDLDPDELVKK
jgi:hypothetical protein